MWTNPRLIEEAKKAVGLFNEGKLTAEFYFDDKLWVLANRKDYQKLKEEIRATFGSFDFEGEVYFIFR